MAKQGWIALHRKIQNHWLWEDKPFCKAAAWIDLLMLANHSDKKIPLGNELVEVKAGSFIISESKLMERWGWGKSKTRAFLEMLQNDKMITKLADRKKTTITIVNYSDYKVFETTKKPQSDRKQTASRPQADSNNNDNNYNNDNKKEKINKKEKALFALNGLFPNYVFSETVKTKIGEWVTYKAERNDIHTEQSLKALLRQIENNCKKYGDTAVIELIDECMGANYKGIIFDKLKKSGKENKKAQFATYDLEAFERMLNAKDSDVIEEDRSV